MPDLPRKEFLTTEEAWKWMGVTRYTFEALAAEHAAWCQPVYHGKGKNRVKRWHREDVWCLAHIWRLSGRATNAPGVPVEPAADEAD